MNVKHPSRSYLSGRRTKRDPRLSFSSKYDRDRVVSIHAPIVLIFFFFFDMLLKRMYETTLTLSLVSMRDVQRHPEFASFFSLLYITHVHVRGTLWIYVQNIVKSTDYLFHIKFE